MLIPFFISYAEIHYHLKYIFPKYYLKQPEIIADIPIRIIKLISNKLPVLIIIKDSHLFPIILNKVTIKIRGKEKTITKIFTLNIKISQTYYSKILFVDLIDLKPEQFLDISVFFMIQQNKKNFTFLNDNYNKLSIETFQCYYAKEKLPYPKYWFAGEPHYHSNYTSDQVEFGADIKSTVKLAKSIGLSWLFVTDHSYDLDDLEMNYLKNDPSITKWEKMHKDVRDCNNNKFRVIAGEEVSIGNSKGRNVHLLAINNEEFIEGSGDSAEIWFHNKPQHL